MRVAAMEVECSSRIAQLQAEHEQKVRELTCEVESKGLSHRALIVKAKKVKNELASLKFCHVQLSETRAEYDTMKHEMAGVVTGVTAACTKQAATIDEQARRVSTLEEDLRAATEILAASQQNSASLEEERLGLVEQLRGERELVDEWKGHEERRAKEAAEWEAMEEASRKQLEAMTRETERLTGEVQASQAIVVSTQTALETHEKRALSLEEELTSLRASLAKEGSSGQALQDQLARAQAEAEQAARTAQEEVAQLKASHAGELSRRAGEVARWRKEGTMLGKKAESGDKLLIKMRDEHKAQEAELMTALEKANAEKALAEREARDSGSEAARKQLSIDKLHQQLNLQQDANKNTQDDLRRRKSELDQALNESQAQCRASDADREKLVGASAAKEEARAEAYRKLGLMERLLEEAERNLQALKKTNVGLEASLAREKEDAAQSRQAASASQGWAEELSSMEALMLKLSDTIRQKESQCKQLQDTVQFGCEERKELQEMIGQLKGSRERQSDSSREGTSSRGAAGTSKTGNKSTNAVQLPNINDKRRASQR